MNSVRHKCLDIVAFFYFAHSLEHSQWVMMLLTKNTKNTPTSSHVNQCFILQNATVVVKDTDYCSLCITFFSYFLFLRSLSCHSQKTSLLFEKMGLSQKSRRYRHTPSLVYSCRLSKHRSLWHSRRHKNHILPLLSSSISKSYLGIVLRIRFGYYLVAVSFSDLIWELFFVRFSLEIPRVKIGMKRLLVFFFFF